MWSLSGTSKIELGEKKKTRAQHRGEASSPSIPWRNGRKTNTMKGYPHPPEPVRHKRSFRTEVRPYFNHRERKPHPLDSNNFRMKQKPEKERLEYQLNSLDPNHSHFILVHNEEYEELQKQEKHTFKLFGTETGLRANIEHCMSDNSHLRR